MPYFGVHHGLTLTLIRHWITLAVTSRLRLATTLAWTCMSLLCTPPWRNSSLVQGASRRSKDDKSLALLSLAFVGAGQPPGVGFVFWIRRRRRRRKRRACTGSTAFRIQIGVLSPDVSQPPAPGLDSGPVTLTCLTHLPRSGVCWRRPNLHGRRVAFIPWRSLWMSSRCGTRVRRRFKMEDTAAPLLALAGPNVLYGRLTAGGARVRTSSAIARRPSLRRMCKGCRPTNGRSSPLIRTRLPDHRRCRCCMTAQALRRRILRLART